MEERERWFLDFARRNRSGKPEHLPFRQGPAFTAAAWSSPIWFTPRR
jgi:hypothetical protein